MRSGEDDEKLTWTVYGAYLVARATGRPPVRKDGGFPTLGEQYAVALGVHHYFAGREPISCRALVLRIGEDCAVPEVLEDRGEETPVGAMLARRLDRLRDFLSQNFPNDDGFSEVDVAVGLLRELKDRREIKVAHVVDRISAFVRESFPEKLDGENAPAAKVADAVVSLLRELKDARKLVAQSVTLARDAVEEERRACAGWLRKAGTGALARQIEAGEHLGPTPPDPGEKGELPNPWRVLPGSKDSLIEAANRDAILVVFADLSADFANKPDVHLDHESVQVRARALTPHGAAFLDAYVKNCS